MILKKYIKKKLCKKKIRQKKTLQEKLSGAPQKMFFCQVKSNLNRLVHHLIFTLLVKKRKFI